ncbi:hypothetical protein BKA67DRAFT_526823, partial [Truncatella angustata]
ILGLFYIPGALRSILASAIGGPLTDYIMKREARDAGRRSADGELQFRPSDRMC